MNILPWRVRKTLSSAFPLAYHLAVNIFRRGRSEAYWDDRLAETWHQRTWPTKNEIIARLTHPDQAILDIACGNGSILRDLQGRGYHDLHGLEISHYAVARLASEGFTMHHGRLPRLAMPDHTYDAVIASQVLEHVIRRNYFAREIARILKPGGNVFIFVPNDCLGPIDEPEHVIKYNERSFRRFLSKHFEIVSIEQIKDANYEMSILFAHARRRGPSI
jgi:2-polyprenyl-3-methyl-5-hydroxy-6-metoxy-1,4-benzoquinol methylase